MYTRWTSSRGPGSTAGQPCEATVAPRIDIFTPSSKHRGIIIPSTNMPIAAPSRMLRLRLTARADTPNRHPDIHHGEFFPRAGHCAVTLPGRKILVHGGQNSKQGQLGDLWILDTVTWEWMKPLPVGTPPTKRSGHAAAFNRQGHVYIFGGWDGVRMRSDFGVLSCSGNAIVTCSPRRRRD
jgi:hypothetical protein